jgi:hypothetical protein
LFEEILRIFSHIGPLWILTEKYLARVINGKYGFAFGAPKTPRLQGFKFLLADGTLKNLGKKGNGFGSGTGSEEINRIIKVIFDIKKLGKAKKLEYFVNLGLDLQENQIPSPGFYRFEKGGKRSDTGG